MIISGAEDLAVVGTEEAGEEEDEVGVVAEVAGHEMGHTVVRIDDFTVTHSEAPGQWTHVYKIWSSDGEWQPVGRAYYARSR